MMVAKLSLKMRGYPHFSFWMPVTLDKIFFSPPDITFAKIPGVFLPGNVLNFTLRCYFVHFSTKLLPRKHFLRLERIPSCPMIVV